MTAYVDRDGRLIGIVAGDAAPPGGRAVDIPPVRGTDIWDGVKWVRDLAEAKEERKDIVDAYRLRLAERGFTYAAYPGKRFQIRKDDLANYLGRFLLALVCILMPQAFKWDPGTEWIAEDNSRVIVATPQDMLAFAKAAFDAVERGIFVARDHKDTIDALQTVAEVEAYDFTTGWGVT